MNDDYLWDGSGEPDPEVQRLERVLSRYRYQPKPLGAGLSSRLNWQRHGWLKLAAVAAAVLIALAGFWIVKLQLKRPIVKQASNEIDNRGEAQATPKSAVSTAEPTRPTPGIKAISSDRSRIAYSRAPLRKGLTSDTSMGGSSFVAQRQPIVIPFIDLETARHLEQAQLMLRSFRNSREPDSRPNPDLAYDKQQSRGLLYKNILLRRDAEAKGNLPAESLLSTLEPFLLDIANLPDRPTADDVRAIKERIRKKEIVSVLQIYSAPMLSESF